MDPKKTDMDQSKNCLARKLIENEENSLAALQTRINNLRNQVRELELRVDQLGDKAKTMPEDLGDWSTATLRIQGLVLRIKQTHALSIEVYNAKAGTNAHHEKGCLHHPPDVDPPAVCEEVRPKTL